VTLNREDAEEVTQEAFFRAFTHLEGFKGDSRFSTWLTRIAINEALMKLRRRRPTVSLAEERETENGVVIHEVEDWGPSPEQRYSQQELQHILSEAMGRLSPDLRLNAGRTLKHVAVVRKLTQVGSIDRGGTFSRDVTVSAETANLRNLRIVAIVQEMAAGRILGVGSARLSN
jgi:hypothetical protein